MSIRIMSHVWGLDLPMADKFVLIAIADASSDEGYAWPSLNTLAEKCSISRQSVINIIGRLKERGLISTETRKRSNGSHASNVYQITLKNEGGVVNVVDQGSQCGGLGVVNDVDHHKNRNKEPKESPTPSAPATSSPSKTLSDHAWFVKWWCFAFATMTGEQYAVTKKSAGIVKNLLASLTIEELVLRTCAFLTLSDAQRFPRGSPTLEGLSGMINQLAGRCTTETEDALFKRGILPDYNITLQQFRPWERQRENHQLSLH